MSRLWLFLLLALVSCGRSYQGPTNPIPVPIRPTPTPTFVFTNLYHVEQGLWHTCGNCGNNLDASGNPIGPMAVYSVIQDSSGATFSIYGPAYTNAYWWLQFPSLDHDVLRYQVSLELLIPAAYQNAPQAIEFDPQQIHLGRLFNFGWQANYVEQIWKTFDYDLNRWQPTSVPFTGFTPDVWHTLVFEAHTDNSQVIIDALTLDGVRSDNLMIVHNSVPKTSVDQFTCGFQLDLNYAGQPYSVQLRNMTISYY